MSDGTERPRLSVVIPAYNVEEYITDCLESLVDQQIADLEVIVVDDGSTDSTAEMAVEFAKHHARWMVVCVDRRGPGGARNEGILHASGEFLAFVDADDVIPPDGYRVLLEAITASGSDLATGNVIRFNAARTWQSKLHADEFGEPARGIAMIERPGLLNDTNSTNKIYRRSYWNGLHFPFPERGVYEDIPVAINALANAKRLDIVAEPVYLWRIREGSNLSTSQRLTEQSVIEDRARAVEKVREVLRNSPAAALVQPWNRRALLLDFARYLEVSDRADSGAQQALLNAIEIHRDNSGSDAFELLPGPEKRAYRKIFVSGQAGIPAAARTLRRARFVRRVRGRIQRTIRR